MNEPSDNKRKQPAETKQPSPTAKVPEIDLSDEEEAAIEAAWAKREVDTRKS